MLLTKSKRTQSRLLGRMKARAAAEVRAPSVYTGLDHERQLSVVDAVEWAVERWASRDLADSKASDPRPAHAARLIAALIYLDARFERLDPSFVVELIDGVAAPPTTHPGPRLDAKAAAALLIVEVNAFRQ